MPISHFGDRTTFPPTANSDVGICSCRIGIKGEYPIVEIFGKHGRCDNRDAVAALTFRRETYPV